MSDFKRRVKPSLLSDVNLEKAPWMAALLRAWVPMGQAAPTVDWIAPDSSKKLSRKRPTALRLAIRDGYLNFYCGGQSIAQVKMLTTLSAETHEKYLSDASVSGQNYLKLSNVHADLADIQARSHGYQGEEKLFIELICAANALIIDLEMALPSFELNGKKVAPRIDLVALEKVPGGWQIVFWEAKLTDDSRLRSQTQPEVIAQLNNYQKWFEAADHKQSVLSAYRDVCALLVQLHNRAVALGGAKTSLAEAIAEIAADPARLVGVDPQVRLLVDARSHDTHWEKVHLPKLLQAGIPVRMIRGDADLSLSALMEPLKGPAQ